MKECNCHRGPEVKTKTVGCPPKVIQINNPAEPVLFHRVDIPAIMGDDVTYPPENGLYKNVLLVYEANNHIYLYNSDGIPTSLTVNTSELEEALEELGVKLDETIEDLSQETTMREGADEELQSNIDAVAQDLEDFKNSPDVVDIVPTYAALQAYDTSELGNNDEIRVLTDETHDGASAYYRWDKTNSQWIFIGITGPYYTKSEIDTTVQGIEGDIEDVQSKIGRAKILTSDDYNWNSDTHDDTEPYNAVALWKLTPGLYTVEQGVSAFIGKDTSFNTWLTTNEQVLWLVSPSGTYGKTLVEIEYRLYSGKQRMGTAYSVSGQDGQIGNYYALARPVNNLTSTDSNVPLAATQGNVLNGKIGDLSTLTTTAKTSTVAAINEINSNLGLAKVLTSADYNYPTNNPTSIALWLLEPGLYVVSGDSTMISYSTTHSAGLKDSYMYLVQGGQYGTVLEIGWGTVTGDGGRKLGGELYTYSGPGALTAHSGKSLITTDYLEISYGAPSATGLDYTSNGKIYIDTETAKAYQYINISGGANRGWVRFGAEEISSTDWDALWS